MLLALQHHDKKLLAEVYREKSFLFQELNQSDSALYYSNEGIKLYQEQKDTLDISILYGRLARIFLKTKQFQKV